jgi:RNA polymerase-interacting CarD/CdnL/TRCF family regulator
MPKVRLNPLIEEIHGTIYDVVFKKSPKGNMIITKRPDMTKVEWSEAQQAHRERFKQATIYAKAALAEPAVRLRYEKRAKRQHKRLWDVAFSDYFQGKDLLSKK